MTPVIYRITLKIDQSVNDLPYLQNVAKKVDNIFRNLTESKKHAPSHPQILWITVFKTLFIFRKQLHKDLLFGFLTKNSSEALTMVG